MYPLNLFGIRCQKLEELLIDELVTEQVHEQLLFPNIKKFICYKSIKNKIERRIWKKSFEQRSAFEKLILSAVSISTSA